MIETKREIILEEGVPVSVFDKENKLFDTTALIGKATRQFFSEISLESHRQGQFLPQLDIHDGLIVKNRVIDSDYIIVASYPEIIDQQKCTTITRMIVCNSKMTVGRLVEYADHRGKITREFKEIYSNLSIYAELLESEVRQMDPGKAPKSRYKIYAPSIELNIEDQIHIDVGGVMMPFKLMGYDYLIFPGLTVLEVVTETRR